MSVDLTMQIPQPPAAVDEETKSSPPASPSNTELTPEELLSAIRKQVEYYFSKENLQQDAYLTSHMDANLSVPLSVIMKFAKMKALTQDESLIFKALETSSVSVIEGNRIKANTKVSGRSTIILREISPDTPEETVRDIFNYEGSKSIVSMRSDIGDTWFVMYESEEDAKDTLLDLRLKKRTFNGQPVKARMKTETIVRSFFPMQATPPLLFPTIGGFAVPLLPQQQQLYNFGLVPLNADGAFDPNALLAATTTIDGEVVDENKLNGSNKGKARAGSTTKDSLNGTTTNTGKSNSRDNSSGSNKKGNSSSATGNAPATNNSTSNAGNNKKGKGSGRKADGSSSNNTSTHKPAPVDISPANFPPLSAASFNAATSTTSTTTAEDGTTTTTEASSTTTSSSTSTTEPPIPEVGYQNRPYHKYSLDNIIDIVRTINTTTLPSTIKAEEHSLAMTTTANIDLLKRQRSRSIEETREQLRQGKPVQQQAIVSATTNNGEGGSVDYVTMMYGDGYHLDSNNHPYGNNNNNNIGNEVVPVFSSHHITNIPFTKNANTWAAMVKSASNDNSNNNTATTTTTATVKAAVPSSPNKTIPANANANAGTATAANASKNNSNNNSKKGAKTNDVNNSNNQAKKQSSNNATTTTAATNNKTKQSTTATATTTTESLPSTTVTTVTATAPAASTTTTADLLLTPPALAATTPVTDLVFTSSNSNDAATTTTATQKSELVPAESNKSNATAATVVVASGWGGKPTFANILKTQAAEEAENKTTPSSNNNKIAVVRSVATTTTATTGKKTTTGEGKSNNNNNGQQRRDDRSKSSKDGKSNNSSSSSSNSNKPRIQSSAGKPKDLSQQQPFDENSSWRNVSSDKKQTATTTESKQQQV